MVKYKYAIEGEKGENYFQYIIKNKTHSSLFLELFGFHPAHSTPNHKTYLYVFEGLKYAF